MRRWDVSSIRADFLNVSPFIVSRKQTNKQIINLPSPLLNLFALLPLRCTTPASLHMPARPLSLFFPAYQPPAAIHLDLRISLLLYMLAPNRLPFDHHDLHLCLRTTPSPRRPHNPRWRTWSRKRHPHRAHAAPLSSIILDQLWRPLTRECAQ